jgi:hypothetical protein
VFRPADTVVTTAVGSRRIGRQSNIGHFGAGDLKITLSNPRSSRTRDASDQAQLREFLIEAGATLQINRA